MGQGNHVPDEPKDLHLTDCISQQQLKEGKCAFIKRDFKQVLVDFPHHVEDKAITI
jgi:hypothetical protein